MIRSDAVTKILGTIVAYKREAHDMWGQLLENIRHNIARSIYHVGLSTAQPAVPRAPDQQNLRENRTEDAALPAAKANGRKVGRNDPCPCGSGKKFKRCHGIAA